MQGLSLGWLFSFLFFIQMTTNVWMPLSTHLFYFMKALDACRACVLSTLRNETFDIVSSMIIPEIFGLVFTYSVGSVV